MKPAYIDISPLIRALNHFHPQSPQVIDYFREHIRLFTFQRGQLMLTSGDVCEHIYFIRRGAVRGLVMEGDRDITTWITTENELVTSISGLDLQLPAMENMEAIENTIALGITTVAMQQLYDQHPEFNITGRKLLQQYYRDAERRALIARLTNAEHKYNFFLQQYPHLSNRIPLKYIASYLGITVETLSRVRKKLSTGYQFS